MDSPPPKQQRQGSYPIQTPGYHPHSNHVASKTDEVLHPLPRTVRALKDASNSRGHERTVVICLDGTGDRFDSDNSNIVHFVSCLKKHTPDEQVTYYQSGIGTYDKGGLKNGFGAAMDMAVGSGLGIHIKDAYRFLMQNWREGDKICLLGFSRGAYTVRCLAGMLHKVGLLPASNGAQVNFAYDFYKDDSENGWKMSAEFKKTFCTDVNVYFVGLWDCVASVGFLPRKLPFSKSPTNSIHYFRHAMALDEHRAKFKVCQWQHTDPDLQRRSTFDNTPQAQISRGFKKTGILKLLGKGKPATVPLTGTAHTNGHSNGYSNDLNRSHTHDSNEKQDKQDELEREFDAYDAARRRHGTVKTDALEVWFMGGHADIGGGAVKNEERHKLAQIPLRWMLRQCFECDTGISFDVAALCEMGMDVHTLYPICNPISKPPTGPSPDLVEHYENKAFPAIQRRSIFLNFKDKKEEEDKTIFHTDHRLAHLSECTEDHFDGMSPVNDMLKIAKGWWILELWPVKVRVLCDGGEGWEKKVRMNMGRYRAIRESNPKIHWTVERMVEDRKYTIKGRTEKNTSWEVVA